MVASVVSAPASLSGVLASLPASLVSPRVVPFASRVCGVGAPVPVAAFVASAPAALLALPARVSAWPCGCGAAGGAGCVCPSLAVFVPGAGSPCVAVWLSPPSPPPPAALEPSLSAVGAAVASSPVGAAVRVGVVGSRSFSALGLVRSFVAALPAGVVVVSGGACGVDRVAEGAASARGLSVSVFPAAWGSALGRLAGVVRNRALVRSCSVVVAFWDGVSAGTASAVSLARAAGVPVFVVSPPPAPGALAQLGLF